MKIRNNTATNMQYVHIKYEYNTPSRQVEEYRKFYQNHVKKAFVQWCAYKGLLDDDFTEEQIERAKKGKLPKEYNIHHITPLSGAGKDNQEINSFQNLCIISKKLHEYINKYYFDPQIKQKRETLIIPYLPQIAVSDKLYNQIKANTQMLINKQNSR